MTTTTATPGVTTPTSTGATTPTTGLAGLASNFQDFLSLLTTQLKNQDPTTPLDTNQFTQELVQFTSVEQQINTNSSLAQLIQMTQTGQVLQSTAVVGHKVEVNSSSMALQGGSGTLRFQAATAGPVNIALFDSAGAQIASAQVNATQGSNDWSWNGTGSNGSSYPDGAYKAAVASLSSTGTTTALPFTIIGKATSVQADGTSLDIDLGSSVFKLSDLKSIVS